MWIGPSWRWMPPHGPAQRAAKAAPAWRRRGLGADRSGVTSVEYALMGALILGAIILAVSGYTDGLGALMANSFSTVAASM